MGVTGLGRAAIERLQLVHILIHKQIGGRVQPALVGGGQIQRTRGQQNQSQQAGQFFAHELRLTETPRATKRVYWQEFTLALAMVQQGETCLTIGLKMKPGRAPASSGK